MTTEHFGIRVKRLMTANVHALIGSLESRMPQAILEQYLREFDDVIAQARVALGRHEAARYQAAKAIARINNEIERLNDLLGTALARNDVIKRATDRLAGLRDDIRETCFLSCWSDRGPMIFRWEVRRRPFLER